MRMGHSIGKYERGKYEDGRYEGGNYEGGTLVVDTVAMHARTWLDNLGHSHSDGLHLIERFRRTESDTLQIDLTFDDPETYARAWTGKKIFHRAPPGTMILDDSVCEEWLEIRERRLY